MASKTLFLHIGMHKTGSSSVQQTFAKLDTEGLHYPLRGKPNHSGPVSYLFDGPTPGAHGARRRMEGAGSVMRERARLERDLATQIESSSAPLTLISAEYLSMMQETAARRAIDYFRSRFDRIMVVGYVRSASGFASSAIQQRVKYARGGEVTSLRVPRPKYQFRFEKYDTIVGRERVILRSYDRIGVEGGGVVTDIAKLMGVGIDPAKVVRSNVSLSLEALALVYCHRYHGSGYELTDEVNRRGNDRLLGELSAIRGRRFTLARQRILSQEAGWRRDLDWIAERLGEPMDAVPDDGPDAVAGLDDLFDVAMEESSLLDRLAPGLSPNDPTPTSIARALEEYIVAVGQPQTIGSFRPQSEYPLGGSRTHEEKTSMNDMANTVADADNDDRELRHALAKAIWSRQSGAAHEPGSEARKAAWQNDRESAHRVAQGVMNALRKQGFELRRLDG